MDFILLGLVICFCVTLWVARGHVGTLLSRCLRFNRPVNSDEYVPEQVARQALFMYSLLFFAFCLSRAPIHLHIPFPTPLAGKNDYVVYLVFLGLLVGYFAIKYVLLYLIGWIIDDKAFAPTVFHITQDYASLSCMVLLPFGFLFGFIFFISSEILIYGSLLIAALGYILYTFRLALFFLSCRYSLFFWILYLCTLDLVPLVLLIQFVAKII